MHLPYDRPPLSKEVLRKEVDDVALKPREWYDENDITLRLGSAATSLDTAAQTVTLADGTVLGYDELVIATGLVPRRIPAFPDLEGIRVLRSFDESVALREHASAAQHAVVVGAGFIGCEVAASLRSLGVDVVLVEPQPTPLASVLGEQIGELVARLHRAEGVDVRLGVGVAEVRGQRHVDTVVLTDGTELPADLVVVGIGSRPATEWLEGSGIEVDNGVICDEAGRTSAPNVWALGDVASWRDATGHQARVEHWSNVADQARVVVPAMLGQDVPSGRGRPVLLERPVRRQDPVPGRAGSHRHRPSRRGRRTQVPGLLRARRGAGRRGRRRDARQGHEGPRQDRRGSAHLRNTELAKDCRARYCQFTGGPCGWHSPSTSSSPPGQLRARTKNLIGVPGPSRAGSSVRWANGE